LIELTKRINERYLELFPFGLRIDQLFTQLIELRYLFFTAVSANKKNLKNSSLSLVIAADHIEDISSAHKQSPRTSELLLNKLCYGLLHKFIVDLPSSDSP